MTQTAPQNLSTAAGLCPHFGECGGCQTQDRSYDDQRAEKAAWLASTFAAYWDAPIPVAPSPRVWHYRNIVDLNFALKRYDTPPPPDFERETVLGFSRKGKWYWPLDIETCLIAPEGTPALLDRVRTWYRETGLRAFDSKAKTGFLRTLLIREGARTGERMVGLFTRPGAIEPEPFVAAVQEAFPAATVVHGESSMAAQGAFADHLHVLDGPGAIEEQLRVAFPHGERTLRFRISPMSFFQTNTLGAEVLYGTIRRYVEEAQPRVLYDLYGGGGAIAFTCADCCPIVRSVENVASASDDGVHNAALNGVDNVFFTTQKMKNYLLQLVETGGMEPGAVAVVDPPRAGMHPKALKRLAACKPERIVYVSCKPSVLAQELAEFMDSYRVTAMEGVDLFPHTRHVELVAVLDRR